MFDNSFERLTSASTYELMNCSRDTSVQGQPCREEDGAGKSTIVGISKKVNILFEGGFDQVGRAFIIVGFIVAASRPINMWENDVL